MRRGITGFLASFVLIALLAGCSNNSNAYGSLEAEVVEGDLGSKAYIGVPYERLLYSKTSKTFAWEEEETDTGISSDIRDRYEKLKNAAPGGYVVGETADDYFICISVEEKSSPREGFAIESLSILQDHDREAAALHVKVRPTEDIHIASYEGNVFVTSLVSIAKKDLPMDARMNEITMTGS
ncbi:hypothetical protein [Paenibacillus spongiae]|uniref:Uncharacterized protein n=1 Tax=Paenibacillus spongiae TaxID=2909671 RepID=A0ABY5S4E9_9BACL|nr:hypothetical protein [Paenibacillus spongiae]UVI28762.1 hypothetical protein L1F29_25470 [Paenibacillus spongiae]